MPSVREPVRILGPWKGLNTSQSGRELGGQWASLARNVLFIDGAITPRPPFLQEPIFNDIISGGSRIWAGIHWKGGNRFAGEIPEDRIIHVDDRLAARQITGISGVQQRTGSFVPGAGRLYYCDGLNVFILSQNEWKLAGLPPPVVLFYVTPAEFAAQTPGTGQIIFTIDDAVNPDASALVTGYETHRFEWAFSFYDSYTDTESNADIAPGLPAGLPALTTPVLKFKAGPMPSGRRVTHVREYRRNVVTAEVSLVLRAQATLSEAQAGYASTQASVGDQDFGPYIPVKNGVPTRATMGLWFENRMLYNDLDNPRYLRYSGDGHPSHVDPLDFLLLDDDGGQITGLAALEGQAVIIKERSIWVMAGVIQGPTNESIALGTLNPTGTVQYRRTAASVGCANTAGGNGAIVCGRPKRVVYNAVDGLYQFDGIGESPLGSAIRPTWQGFQGGPGPAGEGTSGYQQNVHYMLDNERRLLFLLQANQGVAQPAPILALHFDTDGWTEIDITDVDVSGAEATALLPLLGTTLGTNPVGESGAIQLAVAVKSGGVGGPAFVYVAGPEIAGSDSRPMPAFRYETGALILAEGRDLHFYAVKWLHARTTPGAWLRQFFASFVTMPRNVEEAVLVDAGAGISTYQKVSETGSEIRLIVSGGPGTDARWSPELRVVGFEIDAEIIGQR